MHNKTLLHAHIQHYFKIFIVPLALILLCAATPPFYSRSLGDTSIKLSPSQQNKLSDAMKAQTGDTDTPTLTQTETPNPTNTASDSPDPTSTYSETPTNTYTETPTETPTGTSIETPTETLTDTSTETPTETSTLTPTETPTPTATVETQEETPTPCEGPECPKPLMFIRNDGQYDPSIKFEMVGSYGSVVFTNDSILIAIEKPGTKPPWANEGNSQGGSSLTPAPQPVSENGTTSEDYSVVEIHFAGVNSTPIIDGENVLDTKISFFLGNDPSTWQTDIPAFTVIRYSGFAPGYDLEINGGTGTWVWKLVPNGNARSGLDSGKTEKISAKLNAEDGQDLPDLSLEVDGGDVSLEGDSIVVGTDAGNISLPLIQVPANTQPDTPSVDGNVVNSPYTDTGGETTPTTMGYKKNGSNGWNQFLVKAAHFLGLGSFVDWFLTSGQPQNQGDASGDLVFSSFLGGAMDDQARDVAYGPDGSMYVTGSTMETSSWGFTGIRMCSGYYGCWSTDIFVARLNAQRQLASLTFIGGYLDDASSAIAVDESGNAYVVGNSFSPNFPMYSVHAPYQYYHLMWPGENAYATDIILFKLNPALTNLLYATYLGGPFWEFGYGIAYDPGSGGNVYIVGDSDSPENYPPFIYSGGTVEKDSDGVLAGFNTNLGGTASMLTIKFFGGPTSLEQAHGVAVSPMDHSLWIIGQTSPLSGPVSFSTLNGFDSTPGGSFDAYIVHLAPAPSYAVRSSSFFGGSGKDCELDGSYRECDIAVDAAGNAYITGTTLSPDLAQKYTQGGGFQAYGGGADIFAAKVHGQPCDGNAIAECMKLDYWRYLGGSGGDESFSIAVSAAGDAYITGQTGSPNFGRDSFPNALVPDTTISGVDAFLIRLAPEGYVSYFTYLGGTGDERAYGVAFLESAKKAVIVGGMPQALSGFPLVNPVDSSAGTAWEGFVSEFVVPDWERPPLASISLTSPTNWIMVQSLRPTFQWKSATGAVSYLLSIYPVDKQGNALETVPDKVKTVIMQASKICPSTTETCSFKPGLPPVDNTDTSNFELASGTTLEEGGYAWKVFSEDVNGNINSSSEYGYFQIPSLGETWDKVWPYLCDPKYSQYTGPCKHPELYPNKYWNQYDDLIYRYAEQWDVPPSIIKAIMIGETDSAIGPMPIGSGSKITLYAPSDVYGYEPAEDCTYYVNGIDKIDIAMLQIFSQYLLGGGANPPSATVTKCFGQSCKAPYNLTEAELQGISIYDMGIGRGYGVANYKVFEGNGPGCDSKNNYAQYRTVASYGLGMPLYIYEYNNLPQLARKAVELFKNPIPNQIPPEWLYNPAFNILVSGHVLDEKRTACQDSLSAYTNINLDDWVYDASAYDGWGNGDYGKKVIYWAKTYTTPITLWPGVDNVLREHTSHVKGVWAGNEDTCNYYYSKSSGNSKGVSTFYVPSTDMCALSSDSNQRIVSTKSIDMKGNLGVVRVDLVIEEDWINVGWVKIYSDQQGTNLLWQSDLIPDINAVAWIDTVDFNGTPIILAYWGEGAHATRVYPISWDGASFRVVETKDEDGNSIFIGGDGGEIISYSQGFLVAYWRDISAPNDSYEAIVWGFDGSEYREVRRFIALQDGTDHTYPVSTSTVTGELGANGWYKPGVEVEITASDDHAVGSIYYSVTNGMYSEEMTVPMDRVTIPLGEGRWEIKYQAVDESSNKEEIHTMQVLVDGTPPSGTVNASPKTLWPTNGKLKNVVVSGTVVDAQSGVDTVTVEVIDEYGEWKPAAAILQGNGVNNFSWQTNVQLPASRQGTDMNGRTFNIRVTIKDLAGNITILETTVVVPHDQR